MIKISKPEEILTKDFQNLKEQIKKIDQKLNQQIKSLDQKTLDIMNKSEKRLTDQLKKIEQKIENDINKLDQNITNQISKLEQGSIDKIDRLEKRLDEQIDIINKEIEDITNIFDQELGDKFNNLNTKIEGNYKQLIEELESSSSKYDKNLNDQILNVEDKIKIIINSIKAVNDDFSLKFQKMKEEFDTKEEVLRDMLKKFEEDSIEFKNTLQPELEDIKSQQDLVKITVDVLKKQIFESAKEWINDEIKLACKNKEREILMNLWIDELKEVIENFDKLKQTNPKELKIHINEISNTIDSFRQRFIK
ncbi:MAG: hypothetical protein ACFFFT_14765 [Candidatus Thorarchaeota archaeon]